MIWFIIQLIPQASLNSWNPLALSTPKRTAEIRPCLVFIVSLRQQWLHHSGQVENSTNLGGWHAFHQRSWIPTGSQRISISVPDPFEQQVENLVDPLVLLVIFLTDPNPMIMVKSRFFTTIWEDYLLDFFPGMNQTSIYRWWHPAQLHGDCNLLDSYLGRKDHRHHEVSFGVVNTFSLLLTNS